jgi:hypothetical protein
MLSPTTNVVKFAQYCPKLPNLPKPAQELLVRETLKCLQKFRFFFYYYYFFNYIKEAQEHMPTFWIFVTRISPIDNLMSKNRLCVWISAYPFVQNDDSFKVLHVLWVWDFVDMYITHIGTRIWSPLIHIYSKIWFFWAPKHCWMSAWLSEQLFNP